MIMYNYLNELYREGKFSFAVMPAKLYQAAIHRMKVSKLFYKLFFYCRLLVCLLFSLYEF